MRALKMEPARTEIAHFDRSVMAETLLERKIPLLHILGGRVGIKRGEAYCCCRKRTGSEHWRSEVKSRVEKGCRWGEIIRLLSLGKNVRHVVALITPGVHVHWREEHAI